MRSGVGGLLYAGMRRRRPQCGVIRRALGLTQEEFSRVYYIPLGTLRDWEQGRSEPDMSGKMYLTLIALEPVMVALAISKSPRIPA